jgi:chorismate lyase / 3-hydroxybenzoate synthase
MRLVKVNGFGCDGVGVTGLFEVESQADARLAAVGRFNNIDIAMMDRLNAGLHMEVFTAECAFKAVFDASRAELIRSESGAEIHLPMPLLGGEAEEMWGGPGAAMRWCEPFLITEEQDRLVGAALVEITDRLEDPVQLLYDRLLELTRDWHLYRIWNFVPEINATHHGLEHYRQFNIGRWAAFEGRFGRDLRSYMPAASAVGVHGRHFVVMFKAGKTKPLYFENPSQVPAYHYPADYGPRPPGFARGVVIDRAHQRTAFLSGTASIEGHRSIGEHDWALQFKTTLHNMEIMFERMGIAQALKAGAWEQGGIQEARFKCYLRDPEAVPLVKEWFTEHTGLADSHLTFLQADICRRELDMEIEAVVRAGLQEGK